MSLVISPHFSTEEQEGFKERTSLNRLSITGLSRIIEVPLALLETEQQQQQQPNEANEYTEQEQEQRQQPRYWMPPCNNAGILVSEFEGGNVTHSFANRKRSIVKRRKSVLSRSFTPESEAEAIRIEREAALAALENRLKREETDSETDEIYTKSLRRSLSISLPTSTEFGFSDIQNSPILILGRGPVLRRGAKSKFQRRSSCGTPSEITNYLSNTVENQELPPSPTATTATSSSSTSTSSSTSSLSSSPDSPPTFTIQVVDYTNNNNSNDHLSSTMNHPTEQDFKTLEAATIATATDPIFPIETNVKKSKLPWSKKLFSKTKKQKSSSVMIINDNNEKTTDDMMDEVRHNKFNLSSLFFKKQNLNALKKNKSAVNLSTPPSPSPSPSSTKEASPFTSSDTLVSTYYNNNAVDTNNKNQTKTTVTSNFNNNRLPIHKERAIYKLSHLKLTHPRRPLRDQVMISNLMFWYLSIINQSNNNNTNDNSNLSCENTLLPRKAYGIPVAGANRRGTRRKTKTSQVLPEKGSKATAPGRMNSKAMQQQQRLKNANQRTKYRSLGSDDSDSDSDEDELSSSDEDDDDDTDDFNGAEKMHKTNNKYRNHANILNSNNNNNKHHNNTRLQHQQHHPQKRQYQKTFKKSRLNDSNTNDKEEEEEEEDDIPLAMYRKKHVS